MNIKELKLKKNFVVKHIFLYHDLEKYVIKNDLIKKINTLDLNVTINYIEDINSVHVVGNVSFDFDVLDAKIGILLENQKQLYDWNDTYTFTTLNNFSPKNNIIFGDDFDLLQYAIEQLELNLPLNYSSVDRVEPMINKNFIFCSEEDYEKIKIEGKEDARWSKLKDFKFDK